MRVSSGRRPYEGAFLPAMRVRPVSGPARGTILRHGGFDSFIEEFLLWMWYFAPVATR
jgi:hypothetical protein